MCTYITEKANVSGNGKGHSGWFELSHANIYYDHPVHAAMDHALMIDFVNETKGPSARVAIELSAESAARFRKVLLRASGAELDSSAAGKSNQPDGNLAEKLPIVGSGKGPKGWFSLDLANMSTCKPSQSSFDLSLFIEFINQNAGNENSLSVEISAPSAEDIAEKIKIALEAPL